VTSAIVTEARARLAAAFPGWTDETGVAHPTPAARLPVFAVRLSIEDPERVGMGSAQYWQGGALAVLLRFASPPGEAGDAVALDHLSTARAALLAPPADLGGAVWDIQPPSGEPETETAAERLVTLEASFPLRLLI